MAKGQRTAEVQRLDYRPDGGYSLDLEIFRVSDLRRRVGTQVLGAVHRYAFPTLVCVTQGVCTQRIDFELVSCATGSLLLLQPGMVHSFGSAEDWDGWLVLFRPEFVWPSSPGAANQTHTASLDEIPIHLMPSGAETAVIADAIVRMHEDSRMHAAPEHVHALLRYQLYALLMRIRIIHAQQEVHVSTRSRASHRFKAFESLVEKHFTVWHQASRYAERLGCSEKSLARATMDSVGTNPKAFISARIMLEAKRLLAHTDASVSHVSESVGFTDLANFVKFFKRSAACTPMEFRRRHADSG